MGNWFLVELANSLLIDLHRDGRAVEPPVMAAANALWERGVEGHVEAPSVR
jgi:hypothetical protein